MPRPATFRTPADFRAWLERHHATEPELIIRLYKVHATARGLTYQQALDESLCFGWIDGVRRRLDDDSFTQRFTPRRPRSVWSAVNIRRVKQLEAEGRMTDAGRAAFGARRAAPTQQYSYENRPRDLEPAMTKQVKANPAAWADWQARPPGYRSLCAFWILSAKQEATRARRLATLIDCCARGAKLPGLERKP